jgi:hypothetical protein
MSDTRWLTPLIDHTQIATIAASAPATTAAVIVRCGDGWQAPLIWRAASVDPGLSDTEIADKIGRDRTAECCTSAVKATRIGGFRSKPH